MEITRQLFDQQRRPRFGTANPERMHVAFWEWMIRGEESEHPDGEGGVGLPMRDGKLKSSYGPYRARDLFNVPLNREDGPIWTFDRMGATRNALGDGRVVCIGGEHEDFYDPDFCIYNDVVVFEPSGEIEIYGYPKETFPPTDFHTTTLDGDRIVIIGGLGYKNARVCGHTPVYALDLSDFHISSVETTGQMPGWLFEHEAVRAERTITIRGGEIVRERDGGQQFLRNLEEYALDLQSGVWRQVTDRRWPQFRIRRDDGKPFPVSPLPKAEALLPDIVDHVVVHCERRAARFLVEGVELSLDLGISEIEVVVRGYLRETLLSRIAENVRMNAQVIAQSKCSLVQL